MRGMMMVSLFLNLAVLLPVCSGLLLDSTWAKDAYGADSPARQILLAVYLAIGLFSIMLLAKPDARMIAALLIVQMIYKCLTVMTVGTLKHPVVLSNILICVVHAATLLVMWRSGAFAEMESKAEM